MNINQTPNTGLLSKFNVVNYNKIEMVIFPVVELLGPKFFLTLCAILCELSYHASFYTEEMISGTSIIEHLTTFF